MRRDFDLVVTMLSELRDADAAALSREDLVAAVHASIPEGLDAATITHHMDILLDAGLIAPAAVNGDASKGWRLTWKGHDALDQEEEDDDEEA
jgi:DNA-binding transcriptional ArsR family regulator